MSERDPYKWNNLNRMDPVPDWDYWRPIIRDHKLTSGWKEVWEDGQFKGWKASRSRWFGSSRRFMDVRIPWKEFVEFARKHWSANA